MTATTPSTLTPGLRLGIMLAAMLTPLNSTQVAAALPGIGHDLGVAPRSLTAWLVLSYLVIALLAQGPGGRLGDRLGHLYTLRLGLLVFALAALLATFATGP